MKYVVLGIYELAPSRLLSYTNMMLHGFIGKIEVCRRRSLALDLFTSPFHFLVRAQRPISTL
jgi:hypothetical protein